LSATSAVNWNFSADPADGDEGRQMPLAPDGIVANLAPGLARFRHP
jgi:hypothetical protein